MDKKELYEQLTTILSSKQYSFNHEKQRITIKRPYSASLIRHIKKICFAIFGNPHTMSHRWEDDPMHARYKFDSHFIEIDEQTIKIDKYGRLYVDFETVKDKAEDLLINDAEFIKKIEKQVYRKIIKNKSFIYILLKKTLSTIIATLQSYYYSKVKTLLPDADLSSIEMEMPNIDDLIMMEWKITPKVEQDCCCGRPVTVPKKPWHNHLPGPEKKI